MDISYCYLRLNDLLWQLEWCQSDLFESENIKSKIDYVLGIINNY